MATSEQRQILERILTANRIDLQNRVLACENTPDINPDQIPIVVEKILQPEKEIYVVRDDFLCGGTKSRAAFDFLRAHKNYPEYVYISPWYGGASIALPWLIHLLEKEDGIKRKVTIIIDKYALSDFGEFPPYIRISMEMGANIIQIPLDEDKFKFAKEYTRKNSALFIKPGFDYPPVIDKIGNIATQIVARYGRFDFCITAVGSGTLIRGLQKGNIADRYIGICIFKSCPDVGNAIPIIHYQGHNEPVSLDVAPPFRSAQYYDAKIWQYLEGLSGKILLWNVM